MRLDADVRRCVVFLGHASQSDEASFVAFGTGFFVRWEGMRFLVTARHVAVELGEGPYCIRLNKIDGTSDNVFCDTDEEPLTRWISHPDPDVDLVIAPWGFDFEAHGYDGLAISSSLLMPDSGLPLQDVGVGDLCYAIGLFRLLQGKKRNVPIVHTGHIAMMPGDELIPMDDWMTPNTGKRRHVKGYLVQTQNLRGLSGAPVLVRTGLNVLAHSYTRDGKTVQKGPVRATAAYNADVAVLGIWSGSWDAPPDQVASVEYGHDKRVPVGLGTVVPAGRLIELFQLPETLERCKQWGAEARAQRAARNTPATPDVG